MKVLLFTFAFLLAAVAVGQDRASVDTFLRSYEKGHVRADVEWFASHRDPTSLVRQNGSLTTYKEFMAFVEDARKNPPKPFFSDFAFEDSKVEMGGHRAIINAKMRWHYAGSNMSGGCNARFVLTWKDGDWRVWRLDETQE